MVLDVLLRVDLSNRLSSLLFIITICFIFYFLFFYTFLFSVLMRGDPVCLSTTDDITALLHQSIQDQLCYLLQAIYPFDRSFCETVLAQMRLIGMLCGETLCWIAMGQLNGFSQDAIIQTASRFQRQ